VPVTGVLDAAWCSISSCLPSPESRFSLIRSPAASGPQIAGRGPVLGTVRLTTPELMLTAVAFGGCDGGA